jgi:hypothetical protein
VAPPARVAEREKGMLRGWIINLLLVIAVAALAVYAIYRPSEDEAAQHKLTGLAASAVKRIVIEPTGHSAIELERRAEGWVLVKPIEARADRTQVGRILELLSAQSREKLDATDLARFDLDAPELKVRFDEHMIAFGTTNPLSQEQYVRSGDSVYLLGGQYLTLVPREPTRLLTHALFRDSEKPVAFQLEAFRIEQDKGNWRLSPEPAGEKLSQDDLNRWMDDWRLASSLITQPAPATAAGKPVQVAMSDGRKLTLRIVQREPELILLRPDEKLQFHFSAEVAQRMLNPPVPEAARAAQSAVPAQ